MPATIDLSIRPTIWTDSATPVGVSLDQLLYRIRQSDTEGLIFDAVSLEDFLEGAEPIILDALTTTQAKLQRQVRIIERVLKTAGQTLNVVSSQISDPYKRQGVINVAVIFELSDGQTLSILFHNPDAANVKSLKAGDTLISWKWLLNKRDITIVVAPEKGVDQPVRQIAQRVMKLAEKNSAAFARINRQRAERMERIDGLRTEITGLEKTLDGLKSEIGVAKVEKESRDIEFAQRPSRALSALERIKGFLGLSQYRSMVEALNARETAPSESDKALALAELIDTMAVRMQQESKGTEATAYLRYQQGSAEHYIIEKDDSGDGTEGARGWIEAIKAIGDVNIRNLVNGGATLDTGFRPAVLSGVVDVSEPEPAPTQGPLPWDNASESDMDNGRWYGTKVRMTLLDRKRAEKGLQWEGVGAIERLLKTDLLEVKPDGLETEFRLRADDYVIEVLDLVDNKAGEPEPTPEPEPEPTPTPEPEPTLTPEGAENPIKTAKGTKVETGFTVVEANALIASHDAQGNLNPDYPAELQPRDRSREASIAWVRKTAQQLDPDSLGRTRRADTGAPVVGPDRVVESGNGRTMALQEAYRSGHAEEYRQWLIEEAETYGLSAEKIRGMQQPVLVRVRTSAIDRREFAIEANQDDKLSMTGTEKAKADADRLDDALLSRLSDEGDLTTAANRGFLTGFLQSLGDTEAAQYLTSDGNPTGALIQRVQSALFAKAYSDDRLLELTADASKPEIANIVNALNIAAPEFVRARAADAKGAKALTNQVVESVELSLNEQIVQSIVDATNLVRKAKAENRSVDEMVGQLGLFSDINPATAAMAVFINRNNRSGKRLGVAFKAMAQFLRQEAERGQNLDMFGEAKQASLEDILQAANRELDKLYGEGEFKIESLDLFARGGEPEVVPEPEPEPQPAPDARFSPGDTVYLYWLATEQWEPVNYRGPQDDDKAVVVKDGRQMTVPMADLRAEKPTPAPEPEPEPSPTPEDPQTQADRTLLQSVIDGTVADILSADLGEQLMELYERHGGEDAEWADPELKALAEAAMDAYEAAEMAELAKIG